MKTNFTSLKYAVLLSITLFLTGALQAQSLFRFNSTPVLISGTDLTVGAKYSFATVAPGTSAVVTIIGATGGATVAILDDNSLTKPEAFSPQIKIPANSTGMVEFKIEFFNPSLTTLKNMPLVVATAMDIDGSFGSIYENDVLNMGGGNCKYQSSPLEISVTKTGTEFSASNVVGVEYPGVDTTAKQVMFTVTNQNISSFTYKAGAINLGSGSINRQKGIYFKDFDYFNYIILPVKYVSFDAAVTEKNITLKWVTDQEINNNHFEIERSVSGTDFATIGIVLGGFENGTNKSYLFNDNTAELQSTTVVYYRLKQIDNAGRISYSNIIVVKMQSKTAVAIETSPNPFTENLNVRFTTDEIGTAVIDIINSAGQKVMSKQSVVSKGYNTLQLNGLSKLAPGMYVAQLFINGKVTGMQKVIKN